MAIETEVKIEIERRGEVHANYERIYERIGKPAWQIQRNYIFSFGESFLRIRREAEKSYLTVKGKDNGGEFNSRQEIECEIPVEFFIGFASVIGANAQPFYYEKSRASASFMGCQVCLDNFFGTRYCEIEGEKEKIPQVIETLGLRGCPVEKRSYLELLKELKKCPKT